jgi:chorismate lyase / 3-hydroxybenzoate synthase
VDSARKTIACTFDDASSRALGRIAYGAQSGPPRIDDGVPTLPLDMGDTPFTEVWRAFGDVHSGTFNELVYAHDDEYLFCAGFIPCADRYAEAAHRIYADAFALVGELRFPKIFRMWNHIPRINGENRDGMEVYRDFCRGRALAFEEAYASTWGMPAATGIGTWGDGVGFYFLACRESAVKHIENTRQIPAYEYPQLYGPKPPSFARATHLADAATPDAPHTLFVSGTASIVGHETLHAGDLERQWQVMTGNVAHLISDANLLANGSPGAYTLHDLDCIKVYYRRADDARRVMELSNAAFHREANIRYLNVDICRDDLLVEMEGIARRR